MIWGVFLTEPTPIIGPRHTSQRSAEVFQTEHPPACGTTPNPAKQGMLAHQKAWQKWATQLAGGHGSWVLSPGMQQKQTGCGICRLIPSPKTIKQVHQYHHVFQAQYPRKSTRSRPRCRVGIDCLFSLCGGGADRSRRWA